MRATKQDRDALKAKIIDQCRSEGEVTLADFAKRFKTRPSRLHTLFEELVNAGHLVVKRYAGGRNSSPIYTTPASGSNLPPMRPLSPAPWGLRPGCMDYRACVSRG